MPTLDERLDALKKIPLFEGLSQASLEQILETAGELDASAGQILVQHGAQGQGMFVVEEGSVIVERDGKQIELGPGQFFGELALLTETTRTARVHANSKTRLLAINRSDFQTLLANEPAVAVVMLGVLAKRLAQ